MAAADATQVIGAVIGLSESKNVDSTPSLALNNGLAVMHID
jgi:hypothetical protein